jgi:thiol-disulfide isomerase/thioredoxin
MKTQSYLLGLAILAAGCSQSKQTQGYSIEGEVKGVETGKVWLSSFDDATRTSNLIDSAIITNGKFNLKGNAKGAEMVFMSIGEQNFGLSFFLENSKISIKADTSGSQYYDYSSYGGGKGAQLKNFTVSGSTNEDQWKSFSNNPLLKRFDPVLADLNKAYEKAAGKEEKNKVKDQFDSIRNLIMIDRKQLLDSFATANPSSPASVYAFSDYFKFNEQMPLKDMETLMAKFSGEAKSTVYYKGLMKSLDQKRTLQPGQLAPDFTLLKPDSSKLSLSSLRGKYVMLDFWASWCVPCRKAIPHWKEVYAKYQPKGFEILGVTNDSRWKDWFKALDEEKMPWPQVADEFPVKNMPSRVGTLYMAPYLPFYILLDKEGRIILHNPSKEEIDAKLKELLGA